METRTLCPYFCSLTCVMEFATFGILANTCVRYNTKYNGTRIFYNTVLDSIVSIIPLCVLANTSYSTGRK